jgi:hypothetical protein
MTERDVTESVGEQAALAWVESPGRRVMHGLDIAPGKCKAERTIGRVC